MTKISRELKHLVMLPLYALFFFIGAVTVQAATYHVATTGNDSNPGTVTQPFRSIAKGVSVLTAGDTLYLRGGTYAERIDSTVQTLPTGTSYANAPLISSYPGETAILSLPVTSVQDTDQLFIWGSSLQYIIFQNLVLDGGYQNIKVGSGAHHIKFVNVEAKNAWHQCAQFGLDTHDVWFAGGKVHDCGFGQPVATAGYPFYIGGTDHLLENVEVYNSNSFCIHIYDSNVPPQRVTVRNSTVHHCALQRNVSSAIIEKGDGHLIYNNIVYSSSGHGIEAYSGTNAKFYNNTVYGGAETGIYVLPGVTSTDVRNNIAYLNATVPILDSGVGTTLSHNLTSDPRFVNATALNFKLQTSSPAIDAGAFLSQVTTDIKNTPRPQGAAYDIGAYEVGSGSDTASPNPPQDLSIK